MKRPGGRGRRLDTHDGCTDAAAIARVYHARDSEAWLVELDIRMWEGGTGQPVEEAISERGVLEETKACDIT